MSMEANRIVLSLEYLHDNVIDGAVEVTELGSSHINVLVEPDMSLEDFMKLFHQDLIAAWRKCGGAVLLHPKAAS